MSNQYILRILANHYLVMLGDAWLQHSAEEGYVAEAKFDQLFEYVYALLEKGMWQPRPRLAYHTYRLAPFVRGRTWPAAMELFQAMATLYDLNVQVHIRMPPRTKFWDNAKWRRCAETLGMEYTGGQMHWSLPYPVATWEDGKMLWKVPHVVLKRTADQFVGEMKGLMPSATAEQPLFYVQLYYQHDAEEEFGKLFIRTNGKGYEEGFIDVPALAARLAVHECSELSYVTRFLHPKMLTSVINDWKSECKVSGDLEVDLKAASGKLLASMVLLSIDNTVARFEQLLLELGEKAGAESILVNATLAIEPITLQARLVRTKTD